MKETAKEKYIFEMQQDERAKARLRCDCSNVRDRQHETGRAFVDGAWHDDDCQVAVQYYPLTAPISGRAIPRKEGK